MNEIESLSDPGADDDALFGDVSALIESARTRAAAAINSELVLLYWEIGRRVRQHVMAGGRGEYGAAVVERVAGRLRQQYGRAFDERNLFRMVKFFDLCPDRRIVVTLSPLLPWSNVIQVLALEDCRQRDFYLTLCARERWTVRTFRAQISGKLYERTIAARGSDAGVEAEIAALRDGGTTSTALAFRDPYVLDFLGLPAKHSESDLEQAILDEMQLFLCELGAGFAFVERQKRIIVDNKDYHLDLLFYHRHLRCLVAIELKTRDLEPGDFGQMTFYLRWLQAHGHVPGEEPPIGLILCSGKGAEQTALLGLDDGEVRAARYITEPLRAQMQRRLKSAARELPPAAG